MEQLNGPAFPADGYIDKGMSYYQWLVGQLVKVPILWQIDCFSGRRSREDYDGSAEATMNIISDNIINMADKLMEKMEKKQ